MGEEERSLVFTTSGSFKIDGSVHETLRRLAADEWPMFTLSDNQEVIMIRSSEVAAVQNLPATKGRLGFQP